MEEAAKFPVAKPAAGRERRYKVISVACSSSTASETGSSAQQRTMGGDQYQLITRGLSIPFPEPYKLQAHIHCMVPAEQKHIPDFSLISFRKALQPDFT